MSPRETRMLAYLKRQLHLYQLNPRMFSPEIAELEELIKEDETEKPKMVIVKREDETKITELT